jgi:hypothetical protein
MKLAEVRKNAFAMPLNNPAYPKGPYKFCGREFVVRGVPQREAGRELSVCKKRRRLRRGRSRLSFREWTCPGGKQCPWRDVSAGALSLLTATT